MRRLENGSPMHGAGGEGREERGRLSARLTVRLGALAFQVSYNPIPPCPRLMCTLYTIHRVIEKG